MDEHANRTPFSPLHLLLYLKHMLHCVVVNMVGVSVVMRLRLIIVCITVHKHRHYYNTCTANSTPVNLF